MSAFEAMVSEKYDRVVNRQLSERSGTERDFDVCMCCNITGYDSFFAAGGPGEIHISDNFQHSMWSIVHIVCRMYGV